MDNWITQIGIGHTTTSISCKAIMLVFTFNLIKVKLVINFGTAKMSSIECIIHATNDLFKVDKGFKKIILDVLLL